MIIKSPSDLIFDDVFMELPGIVAQTSVFVKLEGLSASGSIKIKTALRMIERLELERQLGPGRSLIESSSGNLGLALSLICAIKGYPFICVSDPNISPYTAKLIKAYGARLIIVKERDKNGGFLSSRIDLINSMLAADSNLVWSNQYSNINNVEAHYLKTGPAILREFPDPSYVFVGVGTTGTLGGISRYLRQYAPDTKIIAVDTIGSVTFGQPSGARHIPGLGTSQPPEIRQHSSFDDLMMVKEEDALSMCYQLAQRGILLGGSSGTVLCGVRQYAGHIAPSDCVVAISPDLGDRYIDTVYNPDWVKLHYPYFNSINETVTIPI
ncbi:2,3-diaminopropionate biosynthesis protein SbnA [Photorhabdus africana]|uniref:2,3-diaminopropionate biosynthesis protein SbnA n=1 Tax=Photorhabdus africana TaxID=3097554 RepID=UPI002B40314F|nr:2,3-diaminopropionate biosynthesis protein SbnA [Photorhabdus sp. CRI-LC]